MKTWSIVTILFLVSFFPPATQATDCGLVPCLKPGECCTVTGYAPPGYPDNKASDPLLVEDDSNQPTKKKFNDDDMGGATPSPDEQSATAEICNSGGNIVGPNGKPDPDLWEGDVEVKMCFEIYVQKQITEVVTICTGSAVKISAGGEIIGGSSGTGSVVCRTVTSIKTVSEPEWVCNSYKEVETCNP